MARILEGINAKNVITVQVIDMHHYLMLTLLKCAKVHEEATFIAQPPNADGHIIRSIEGQDLHGAIAALRLRVGAVYDTDKTRMVTDLIRMKMPLGMPFADWCSLFSMKVHDIEVLAGYTFGGPGRESEVFNYFEKTLTPAYNNLLMEFATTHHATQMRTFQIFKDWAMPRTAYIEDLERRAHAVQMASNTAAEQTPTAEDATSTVANVAQATANGIAIVKTLTDAQLRDAGLKIVKTSDRDHKDNRDSKDKQRKPAAKDNKPTTVSGGLNTHNMTYCWTHGFYPAGHKALHKSADCRNPAAGHQVTATAKNTQGGSGKIYA
jgi:hypothetical protein